MNGPPARAADRPPNEGRRTKDGSGPGSAIRPSSFALRPSSLTGSLHTRLLAAFGLVILVTLLSAGSAVVWLVQEYQRRLAVDRLTEIALAAALERLIGRLDPSSPDALANGFVALRQHLAHTRAELDIAIDFLDKAVEELGGTPPYQGKAADQRALAEEGP